MKKIIFAAVIVFALIQFIPVGRNNPSVVSDFNGPDAVSDLLRRSCYDCHSNETRWPWYSRVAPVSWMIAHDVKEARGRLNFSKWGQYSSKEKDVIKREIYEEVKEKGMPLPMYLLMHTDARMSPQDLKVLSNWQQ